MATPYLSVVKSRYSYFVPEVQARLKAVLTNIEHRSRSAGALY